MLLSCLALVVSAWLVLPAASMAAPSIGVQFANYGEFKSETALDEVQESGAKVYRVNMNWGYQRSEGWAPYDELFGLAAERGITVLPDFYGNKTGDKPYPEANAEWLTFVSEAVHRYGYGGTFWSNREVFAGEPLPPPAWEVWNEENFAENSAGGTTSASGYASFLKATSEAIRNAQSGYQVKVLFGGVWWEGLGQPGTSYVQSACLNGAAPYFDGLSIHPYAISGTGKAARAESEIQSARTTLDNYCGTSKTIWVTELGWPRDTERTQKEIENKEENFPAVSETEQASLLTETFGWMKSNAASLKLETAIWYNRKDEAPAEHTHKWDFHCGLQSTSGQHLASWTAFYNVAGGLQTKPNVKTTVPTSVVETEATLNGSINPDGAATTYKFEYGPGPSYGSVAPIPSGSVSSGTSRVNVSTSLTGLLPGRTMHYRLVATNSYGTAYGHDQTLTTTSYRYQLGTSSGTGISSWNRVLSNSPSETLTVGDFNGDGKADLVETEPEGGSKYQYMLGLSNGSGISGWKKVLSGMSQPVAVAAGDVNGDGKADLVAAEPEAGTGKYEYMLGISNGTGISSWTRVLQGMSRPVAIAAGDFNGDGKADVAAAEPEAGTGKYEYMLGTGSGTGISNWSRFLAEMSLPTSVSAGDFNGDGKADLIASEPEPNTGKYEFMKSQGVSAGLSGWTQVLGGLTRPLAVGVGDLTGDGKADVTDIETEPNGSFHYMLGTSNGTAVSSWTPIESGMRKPRFAAVGDVNGDGKADLIGVEVEGGSSYQYMFGLSNGSGIASWHKVLSGMSEPVAIAAGDVTGDGKADIVAAEPEGGTGKYEYMLGTSNGTGISSWTKILSGMSRPVAIAVADFNGDGKADIIAAEPEAGTEKYEYMLGLAGGGGIASWTRVLQGMSRPVAIAAGDFNGDGKADVAAAEPEAGTGKYEYMLGTGSGTGISNWSRFLAEMSKPTSVSAGDFNGDGKADLIASEPEPSTGKYEFMKSQGINTGLSGWSQVLGGLNLPLVAGVGDFTGDGKADIISGEQGS